MDSNNAESDSRIMQFSLELARNGLGHTKTNPAVGCVIVKNGKIIGAGYHKQFGGPHAEVFALEEAGINAKGATVYLTLEPCVAFKGKKTPSCAGKLILAGVKKVIIATLDPNPKVSGKGLSLLRKAGIEVKIGVLEKEAVELILPYSKFIQTKKPFTFLKVAMSLDNKIAKNGRKYISGKEWLEFVHKLRGESDAILVGIGTIQKDNPSLTTWLVNGKDPLRVILDTKLDIPMNSKVLSDKNILIVASKKEYDKTKYAQLRKKGFEILLLKSNQTHIDWALLLLELGNKNIGTLMIEGGSQIIGSALAAKIIDKAYFGIVPEFFGEGVDLISGSQAPDVKFKILSMKPMGKDYCIEAVPVY
jgi:diaminohydroxyphosphoribosylaminopyrimidine deaminase/5-amino-6-(5-phosphoribosylamino)uracil reductase